MDPLSQGVLGAVCASLAAKHRTIRPALFIGAITGMAPDLDVLIRSQMDPLLGLYYHRHFTHALPLVPLFALLCALLLRPAFKQRFSFGLLYLFCLLGWGSHGLLDGCTTYGTFLWWPFSIDRVSWDIHSIVDPFYTFPILLCVYFACRYRTPQAGWLAVAYSLCFSLYGYWQHGRVEEAVQQLAASRGHMAITQTRAMPTIGNSWLWRTVYAHEDRWYADAIYLLPWQQTARYYAGSSAPQLLQQDVPSVPADSLLGQDMDIFFRFTQGYTTRLPDENGLTRLSDVRYSFPPQGMQPFWVIAFRPENTQQHVHFQHPDIRGMERSAALWPMIQGQGALPIPVAPSSLRRR